MSREDGDPIREPVEGDDVPCSLRDDGLHLAGVDVLYPGTCSHHRQDAAAHSDFKNARVRTHGEFQRGFVSGVANHVLQHPKKPARHVHRKRFADQRTHPSVVGRERMRAIG